LFKGTLVWLRENRWGGAALTFFLSASGVVWATWPLVRQIDGATIDKADPWPAAWQINWLHHILLSDPLGWADANIFFPYEGVLATTDLLLTHALVTFPIALLGADVLAYNVALLGGVALCGTAGFLLVDEITDARWAAILAGTMLALTPFRFNHIAHLPIIAAWPAPLLCWVLLRFFRTPTWGWASGAALSGVLVVGGSLYQALYLAPLLPLVVWFASGRGAADRRAWLMLTATYAAATPVLVALLFPFWKNLQTWGIPFHASDLQRFAADITSLAARQHFLVAARSSFLLNAEARLYPGSVLSILSLAAVAVALRGTWIRGGAARGLSATLCAFTATLAFGFLLEPQTFLYRAWALAVLAMVWLIPIILAVGLGFELRRESASGPTNAIAFGLAGAAWAAALSLGPILHIRRESIGAAPYALLLQLTSVYQGTRVPARFGGFTLMFLCIAAAGVLALLVAAAQRKVPRRLVVGTLSAMVLVGLAMDLPTNRPNLVPVPETDRPEYRWLAARQGEFGVLELPETGQRSHWERSFYMLASRRHFKPLVNGTSGQIPPMHDWFFKQPLWTEDWFWIVRSYLPVRYVVVHEEFLAPEVRLDLLPRLASGHQGWRRVFYAEGTWVFEVDRASGRGAAIDRIYRRSDLAPGVRLSFEVRSENAVEADLSVELLRDDQPVASWPIDETWRRITVDVPVEAASRDAVRRPLPAPPIFPPSTTLFTWRILPLVADRLVVRNISMTVVHDGLR